MSFSFILYRIPSSFSRFFFRRSGIKIFQNLIFFIAMEKKWIFLPYRVNIFLKLDFKKLKVVLEAAEAVEATVMNTQTLKELGIEQKKVPSNIRNEKKSLRFFVQSQTEVCPRAGLCSLEFLLQPSLRSEQ